MGEEDFRKTIKSSHDFFVSYFLGLAQKNKDLVFKSLTDIMTFPLAELVVDYQEVVNTISKTMVGYSTDSDVEPIIKILGADAIKLIKLSISDWVIDAFNSDMTLQTALLCVYQIMAQSNTQSNASVGQNPYSKAARR